MCTLHGRHINVQTVVLLFIIMQFQLEVHLQQHCLHLVSGSHACRSKCSNCIMILLFYCMHAVSTNSLSSTALPTPGMWLIVMLK